MTQYSIDALPADAHAIRPVRVQDEQEEAWEYTAVTFAYESGSRSGVDMWLRRLGSDVQDDGSGYQLDILNEHDDIVAEFPVTQAGFEYLRNRLKFRRVRR